MPSVHPVSLFGNFLNVALGIVHPVDFRKNVYYELAGHKHGGLFQDTALDDLRSGTNQQRAHKRLHVLPRSRYFFGLNHPSFADNPQWWVIRNKLRPVFTPGKFELMYDRIKKCGGGGVLKNIRMSITKFYNVTEALARRHGKIFNRRRWHLRVWSQVVNAVGDDESAFGKYRKTLFKLSLQKCI